MGQGGCERRIEVFVKIQKKKLGGGGVGSGGGGQVGGVRVYVNEELKFLGKLTKKISGGGVGRGGSGRWGVGLVGGGGQGGCERRIEAFGKIHKKNFGGGGGWGWEGGSGWWGVRLVGGSGWM